MNNHDLIQHQIKRFCFEKLKNNQEPLERFETLVNSNSNMIENAVKPQLISAAIIFSYLREHKLNGRGGITTKQLAEYFEVKPQAITSKVFDVDCIVNRSAIFPEDLNEPYEFIDIDRFEVSEEYYEFLESPEADDYKKSEKILLKLIKQDPDFFDTYTVLHEYYLNSGKGTKAYNLMAKGYERAMGLLLNKNGRYPTSLPWGYVENRHIIRILFNFAALLWLNSDTKNALDIFNRLLKTDPDDNIGARYMIVAIHEGIKSLFEFEEMFNDENGNWDWQAQEKWFWEVSGKYEKEIGWWIDSLE
jgi:tetratricopeptide (TPR) repeat protein